MPIPIFDYEPADEYRRREEKETQRALNPPAPPAPPQTPQLPPPAPTWQQPDPLAQSYAAGQSLGLGGPTDFWQQAARMPMPPISPVMGAAAFGQRLGSDPALQQRIVGDPNDPNNLGMGGNLMREGFGALGGMVGPQGEQFGRRFGTQAAQNLRAIGDFTRETVARPIAGQLARTNPIIPLASEMLSRPLKEWPSYDERVRKAMPMSAQSMFMQPVQPGYEADVPDDARIDQRVAAEWAAAKQAHAQQHPTVRQVGEMVFDPLGLVMNRVMRGAGLPEGLAAMYTMVDKLDWAANIATATKEGLGYMALWSVGLRSVYGLGGFLGDLVRGVPKTPETAAKVMTEATKAAWEAQGGLPESVVMPMEGGGGRRIARDQYDTELWPGLEDTFRRQFEAGGQVDLGKYPDLSAAFEGAEQEFIRSRPGWRLREALDQFMANRFPEWSERIRESVRRNVQDFAVDTAGTVPGGPRQSEMRSTYAAAPDDPSKRYDVEYAVVDLDDLIPSHTDAGRMHPDYPSELQPRERDRAGSNEQIERIARDLDPEGVLGEFHTTDRGTPIVGDDNVVESGNGRTLALRRARAQYPERWAQYQQAAQAKASELGLSTEGMSNPVVVRRRSGEIDRVEFAREANTVSGLALSTTEQAGVDTEAMDEEFIKSLAIEETETLDAALKNRRYNRDVVQKWIGKLPQNERASLLGSDGSLNYAGIDRFKAAMLRKTLPGEAGERLVETFADSLDSSIRRVENGTTTALPQIARAESMMRAGERPANLSLMEDYAAAANVLARLRQEKMGVPTYLSQSSMFDRELTPFQETLLQHLDSISSSQVAIRTYLREYAHQIELAPDPRQEGMFAGETVSKEQIHERTVAATSDEPAAAQGQRSLFETPSGRQEGAPPAVAQEPAVVARADTAAARPAVVAPLDSIDRDGAQYEGTGYRMHQVEDKLYLAFKRFPGEGALRLKEQGWRQSGTTKMYAITLQPGDDPASVAQTAEDLMSGQADDDPGIVPHASDLMRAGGKPWEDFIGQQNTPNLAYLYQNMVGGTQDGVLGAEVRDRWMRVTAGRKEASYTLDEWLKQIAPKQEPIANRIGGYKVPEPERAKVKTPQVPATPKAVEPKAADSFERGDRVVTQHGLHGTIEEALGVTMSSVMGSKTHETVMHTVRLDTGSRASAGSGLTAEPWGKAPPAPWRDPEVNGRRRGADQTLAELRSMQGRLSAATGRLKRARSDSGRAKAKRDIARLQPDVDKYLNAWRVFSERSPEIARAFEAGTRLEDIVAGKPVKSAAPSGRGRGYTSAAQEQAAALAAKREAADPTKWKQGDGVGYRVASGGKTDQINRGFRIIKRNPEKKQVQVRSVADTGLTSTGGDADRIPDLWVPMGDLVRDRKYDLPSRAPRAAAQTTGAEITERSAQGGVEVSFPGKPPAETIAQLRAFGFKWARRNKVWYKRPYSEGERARIVKQATEAFGKEPTDGVPKPTERPEQREGAQEPPTGDSGALEAAPEGDAPRGTRIQPEEGGLEPRPGDRADVPADQGRTRRGTGVVRGDEGDRPASSIAVPISRAGKNVPGDGYSIKAFGDMANIHFAVRPPSASQRILRDLGFKPVGTPTPDLIWERAPGEGETVASVMKQADDALVQFRNDVGVKDAPAPPVEKPAPIRLPKPTGTAPGRDYVITSADALGKGGWKGKFNDNMNAIQTLQAMTAEGRLATAEEQAALVKYVGWGASAFNPAWGARYQTDYYDKNKADRAGWLTQYEAVRSVLSADEFRAASRSRTNAHYTSPEVIKGMWAAMERLGIGTIERPHILEPGAGVGHFLGLMPNELASRSRRTAIELDTTTGRILEQLYQNATVHVSGYQDVTIAPNSQDLVISNVPFSETGMIVDDWMRGPNKWLGNLALHNQYFARAMEQTRPGGVVAFITSRFTMDGQKAKRLRNYLSDSADLIGAIRLPDTAFKANAGTEVVTDIVFLRKRELGDPRGGEAWADLERVDAEGYRPQTQYSRGGWIETDSRPKINEYYLAHPEMVLGKHSLTGSMYQGDAYTVKAVGDLSEKLAAAIENLPEGIIKPARATTDPQQPKAAAEVTGAYVKDGDALMIRTAKGDLVPLVRKPADAERIGRYIDLRDAGRELNRVQIARGGGIAWQLAADRLNSLYDSFVRKYGPLQYNSAKFRDDPDSAFTLGLLENSMSYAEARDLRKTAGVRAWSQLSADDLAALKTEFFRRPLVRVDDPVTASDTPEDALLVSLRETGSVNAERIGELLGIDPVQVAGSLGDMVFFEPATRQMVVADEYLSGDVRDKLRDARQWADLDPQYARNVEALEEVQPEDVPPSEIVVRPGAPWIPPEVPGAFLTELLGETFEFKYLPALAEWRLVRQGYRGGAARQEWSAGGYAPQDLLLSVMNGKQIKVNPSKAATSRLGVDVAKQQAFESTVAAQAKAQELVDRFQSWVWDDADRAARLHRTYNDTFNGYRLREYDGSHLTFPGMNKNVALMPHQNNFVWRALVEGNALAAHQVGAGKTFEMIAAGMELRRLGQSKRNMYVVPNHLVRQWAAEFIKLYPNARLLVPHEKSFTADRRQATYAKIISGDWDGIILPQSQFTALPVSVRSYERFASEVINDYHEALLELDAQKGDERAERQTQKQIEKALAAFEKKVETKLKKLRANQDQVTVFEAMGIDALFVDEADMFKNLMFPTRMGRLRGLPNSDSQRAFDMYVKTRMVRERTGGRGIYFGTGTPISNTVAEVWTMMRYLQPEILRAKGLHRFDAFAQQFTNTKTAVQLTATGAYRPVTALSEYVNAPELSKLFQQTADIILSEDIPELKKLLPQVRGGGREIVVCDGSPELEGFLLELAGRMEKIGQVDPKEDNALKIYGEARHAALDMRLVRPDLPATANGKIDRAIERVKEIWDETAGESGAQLVFCDLSTPKARSGKDDVSASDERGAETGQEAKFRSNVYAEIKDGLMAAGIPEGEIAFIHDAKNSQAKSRLFSRVNSGEVRVLIGSTEKMGTGMNVQTRLAALHHITTPWRPRDVEQREGRIIRQGNAVYGPVIDSDTGEVVEVGPGVRLLQYLTEGSFDGVSWQIIETKWGYIKGMMKRNVQDRVIQEMDEDLMDAATMKALATGNTLALERAQVENELVKTRALQASWLNRRVKARNDLKYIPERIQRQSTVRQQVEVDMAAVEAADKYLTVNGQDYAKDDRKAGIEALYDKVLVELLRLDTTDNAVRQVIADYRGLGVRVALGGRTTVYGTEESFNFQLINENGVNPRLYDTSTMSLIRKKGQLIPKEAPGGWLLRLDNTIKAMPEAIRITEHRIKSMNDEIEGAKFDLSQPDPTNGQAALLQQSLALIDKGLADGKTSAEGVPELVALRENWEANRLTPAIADLPSAETVSADVVEPEPVVEPQLAPATEPATDPAAVATAPTKVTTLPPQGAERVQSPTEDIAPLEGSSPKVYETERGLVDIERTAPGKPMNYRMMAVQFVDQVHDTLPPDHMAWVDSQRTGTDDYDYLILDIAKRYQDVTPEETKAIIAQLYDEAVAEAAKPDPTRDAIRAGEDAADALFAEAATTTGPAEVPRSPAPPVIVPEIEAATPERARQLMDWVQNKGKPDRLDATQRAFFTWLEGLGDPERQSLLERLARLLRPSSTGLETYHELVLLSRLRGNWPKPDYPIMEPRSPWAEPELESAMGRNEAVSPPLPPDTLPDTLVSTELPAPVETHNAVTNVHGTSDGGDLISGHNVIRDGQPTLRPDVTVAQVEWDALKGSREKLQLLADKLAPAQRGKINEHRAALDTLSKRLQAAMRDRLTDEQDRLAAQRSRLALLTGRLGDASQSAQVRAEAARDLAAAKAEAEAEQVRRQVQVEAQAEAKAEAEASLKRISTRREALDNAKGRLTAAIQAALASKRGDMELSTGRLGAGLDAAKVAPAVKIMVTRKDRSELGQLGYTDEQIDAMKPDEAAQIVHDGVGAGDTVAPPGGGGPPGPPPVQALLPLPPDPDDELRKLAGSTTRSGTPARERYEVKQEQLIRAWYDRLHPMKGVSAEAYSKARTVPGMVTAGEAILRKHVYPVLDEVKKDLPQLEQYMIAMRMLDARVINPDAKLAGGVDDPNAALSALKASMSEERFRQIEETADKLWDLNDRFILEPAVKSGRISVEAYEAMRERWPHYIPFFRQGWEDWESRMRPSTRQPASIAKSFSRAISEEGSERKLVDPMGSWLSQFVRTQVENARNSAATTFVEALDDMGLVERGPHLRAGPSTDFIHYWEDGDRKSVRVPKLYADVAKSMEAEPQHAFISFLRKVSMPLRVGATSANPAFLFVNPLRDASTAWLQEGVIPFGSHWWSGMRSAFMKDETWQEAAEAGIFMSGMDTFSAPVKRHIRGRGMPLSIPVRNVGDVFAWLPRVVMELNERMEQGTRVAAWTHLKDLPEAARVLRTRDATVDFSKSGYAMQWLNQIRPFTNVGVQALGNLGRLAKENPRKLIMRALPFVAIAMLASAWNNMMFPDTHEMIPDYERAKNFIVQVGEGQEEPDPRYPNSSTGRFPIYVKIPKGDAVAGLLAIPEAFMDYAWRRGDKTIFEALLDGGKNFLGSLSPIEASAADLTLPIVGTVTELAVNKNFYTGRDIVPRGEMSRPAEYQFNYRTPAASVLLGQVSHVSPRKISHAIRGIAGGGGSFYAETITSMVLRAIGYNPQEPGGINRRVLTQAERVADLPVLYRFAGTRRNESDRQTYRKLDRALAKSRRELYKNDEFQRFGMGVNSPGTSYSIDGVAHEVSPRARLEILEATTPLIRGALDDLQYQRYYQDANDAERRQMIETVRRKIGDNVRAHVMEGELLWTVEDMPRLTQALGEYQTYNRMSVYLGIDAEQEALVRMANARTTAIRKANPQISLDQARLMAARENPEGVRFAMIASRFRNPARKEYWASHPLLSVYFGNLTLGDLEEIGVAA